MNRIQIICKMFLLIITSLLMINGCYKEQIVVDVNNEFAGVRVFKINQAEGFVDTDDQQIFFTIGADTLQAFSSTIHFYDYTSIQMEGEALINNEVNYLGDIIINHPYEIIAKKELRTDTFSLIFTRLPLIHIITDNEITDEPKVFSNISIQYCDEEKDSRITNFFNSYAGIEIRGASSMRYNKKSYGIELWKNRYEDDYKTSLLDMRSGEDWILDAMYIDDLRMRNKISFEIWEKMSAAPAEDLKPGVYPGIHCKFVELFINNQYFGLYSLNEKLDENLLQFSSRQYELGGVLYKAIQWADGATTFASYNSDPPNNYFWDGWELIYPKHVIAWDPLAHLRQHIIFSNDTEFKNEIESLFDIDNAINYFLFLNLLLASDNTGKNTYLARYTDQSPFFMMPWDIEASWGLFWDRSRINPNGIVSNHFFERLIDTDACEFNSRLREQWFEYRSNVLSEEALLQPINEYYNILKNSGVIDRENSRWDEINIDLDDEYQYITEWIRIRLEYLDNYFENND